jgi:hypothetical protein
VAGSLSEHLLQVALGFLVAGTRRRDPTDLAVVVAEARTGLDPAAGDLDVGDVSEGPDRSAWPGHVRSPPLGSTIRLDLALLAQPLVHVADEVAELASDVDRARPLSSEPPVVEGPSRDVEVVREFLDAHQRLQAAQGG